MVAKPKACAQTEARRRMGCGSTRLGRFAHSDLGESLGTAPPPSREKCSQWPQREKDVFDGREKALGGNSVGK